jgi:Mn-dependent DtxR family transcriptional regulator
LKIHESAEDYLETILILSQRQPSVRSIDIATELDYSKRQCRDETLKRERLHHGK